ncbi:MULTISPECIES: hypothetical protein [Bacteroides]|jgi:predicted transposase/invertase (TIGR01784 family)|uniref:hypothetical protein n=1 Tax=Bacteroides TaxID=816 RepID=UPI001C37A66F|nr:MULTISPECIES: hypothetical protein [Bacteroides]MBV3638389.1 hypothetical protein [Bacteroides cellulosilyticus]MBV3664654.1 hypothetical protein [Bacteroides cellulosilyticus]MBV3686640.1 hypothetical protein [Bacteroides cellulosilyticus]MBV3695432.1 hypothetical protein [Bacteroides cellulosilyticus]MBV3709001.1 hypothetical protein [Bacteroides cellulosilyticus]
MATLLEPFPYSKEGLAEMKAVLDSYDVDSLSKEERRRYENSVNVYRTNLCVMDAAKEEGREEGRQEVRLANARSMKAEGFTNAVISKITGLSEDEIAAL